MAQARFDAVPEDGSTMEMLRLKVRRLKDRADLFGHAHRSRSQTPMDLHTE